MRPAIDQFIRRKDIIHTPVVRFVRDMVDDLKTVGEGEDRRGGGREQPVVITFSIPDAVAAPVEGDAGDDDEVGLARADIRRLRARFEDAEFAGNELGERGHAMKAQSGAFDTRQGDGASLAEKFIEDAARGGFAAGGDIERGKLRLAPERERPKARGEGLADLFDAGRRQRIPVHEHAPAQVGLVRYHAGKEKGNCGNGKAETGLRGRRWGVLSERAGASARRRVGNPMPCHFAEDLGFTGQGAIREGGDPGKTRNLPRFEVTPARSEGTPYPAVMPARSEGALPADSNTAHPE